jgi:hypothetical protein
MVYTQLFIGQLLMTGTWGLLTLIPRCPVKTSKDFKDITIAVVAFELVSSAVKAKHQFARFSASTLHVDIHDGSCGAMVIVCRISRPRGRMGPLIRLCIRRQVRLVHRYACFLSWYER